MPNPAIPGPDVTELSGSRAVAPSLRPNWTYGAPPAPPGPSTALAPRPYEPNFTMPRAAPMDTGARQAFDFDAKPASRVQQGMRSLREAGSRAVAAIPGPVKTAGRIIGKAAAPLAAGTAVAEGMEPDSTARYAKRFGVDEPTGDGSLGDIAKFTALRAGGFASDLGNALTGGLASRFYADSQPGVMPAPPTAPPVAPSPNPTDLRLASGTQRPPVPDGAPIGPTITRSGNSFSDGSNPGALSRVSTIGNGGVAADMQQLANLRSLPGPELGGMTGFNHRGGTETFGPSLSVLGASGSQRPRDLRHAAGLATERAIASERMGNERAVAGMRETGDMRRAQLGADTQRMVNERQVDAQLRGQDITREGHMVSAAGQRARLVYDMNKDQRDFQTGRNDKAFEQRQGRESQLQKNIEAVTADLDSDGKPVVNAKAAAEYRSGIDRSVARMGAGGVHELSPLDEQRLMAGSDLLRTMRANAGWLPWQPDKLKTIDPLDLTNLRVLPNGDRQITRADSKAAGQVIPRRFFDTMEGARFFGGTPTNRYDMLSEGK